MLDKTRTGIIGGKSLKSILRPLKLKPYQKENRPPRALHSPICHSSPPRPAPRYATRDALHHATPQVRVAGRARADTLACRRGVSPRAWVSWPCTSKSTSHGQYRVSGNRSRINGRVSAKRRSRLLDGRLTPLRCRAREGGVRFPPFYFSSNFSVLQNGPR